MMLVCRLVISVVCFSFATIDTNVGEGEREEFVEEFAGEDQGQADQGKPPC